MRMQTPPPEKRAQRLHPVFRIMIVGATLIFLLLAMIFGLIFKEYHRRIALPELMDSRPEFLERNDIDLSRESHGQAQIRTGNGEKPNVKSASANVTSGSLKYKPVIPDAAEIAPELRVRTKEINLLFDRVFSDVENYERKKDALTPEDALKQIAQIERLDTVAYIKSQNVVNEWRNGAIIALGHHGELAAEQNKIHQIADAIMNLIQEHNWELTQWSHGAKAEVYARMKQWGAASNFAWARLNSMKWLWQIRQFERNDGKPVFISDFYKTANEREYERVIYFYQQRGGLEGFLQIADLYLQRKKEVILDHWSGGQKRSPAGVTVVVKKR